MIQGAFDKIAAGLNEALEIARGGTMPVIGEIRVFQGETRSPYSGSGGMSQGYQAIWTGTEWAHTGTSEWDAALAAR